MGQSNSNSQIIATDNQSHERLGVIKVVEISDMFNEHQSNYQLQIKKPLESQEKFQKWLKKMRQIDTQQARDVLYLPLSFKFQKTAICGSSGQLTLTFDYFPYVLKTQIRNRRKMSQYFQQSQLWYLMYNLVEAGTIFQRKGYKLGDIHPNNCLLNQNGQFKIIASCSLPDESTNYDKIVESPTNDAFLAPQQIDPTFLQKGIYPHIDECRAQVYSAGVTLLEAATLQDCFYTYSRGPYKINKKKLADLLKTVKQKYSKLFYNYLSSMLEEQSKRRKAFSQVFKELHPYQDAILELRQWVMGQSNNGAVSESNYSKQRTEIMNNSGNAFQSYQKTKNPYNQTYQQQNYDPLVYRNNQNSMAANTVIRGQNKQVINSNQTIGYNQAVQSQSGPFRVESSNNQTISMTSIDRSLGGR